MRAALYHRVSTADQNTTNARLELRAAAAARGLEVVLDIEETGSGARNDRPGLQRLMAVVRRHQVDQVLVWKLDRFGRSALDLLANLRELDTAGVTFSCITQGIELRPGGDAISRLQVNMLAAFAEFERDLTRERILAGMARARREGKHLGRPREGRPMPDGAEVVRRRADGQSWRAIAAALGCREWEARRAAKAYHQAAPAPVEPAAAGTRAA